MSKVSVDFKALSIICGAAHSPEAALKLALEWAEKAEVIGLGQQARADDLEQQLAALREAATEYLHTGHTPRCWAQWNGRSNPVTHPACICGHDKLKALLQEKGE